LESVDCDILFQPSVQEMYTDQEQWSIDLGNLDSIWEGQKRPGHFQGVTQIVYKLFNLVQPDIACFGQKDFQQVMVIQQMIKSKALAIEIALCPIVRSPEGLALSSRNVRLSPIGKIQALALYQTLAFCKDNFRTLNPQELTKQAIQRLNQSAGLTLEYFAICETDSLALANTIEQDKNYVALLTAWVDGVRLIDNMLLD